MRKKDKNWSKNTYALGVMHLAGNTPWPAEQGRRLKGSLRTLGTGEHLFQEIRVPTCLVPFVADALWLGSDKGASSPGSVRGIYSDLLLHRLGGELASGGSSYGRGMPVLVQTRRAAQDKSRATGSLAERARSDEWRTPPLWGVADSAPYLHDGRADTLEEAIRLHSGQADNAARRFAKLTRGGRTN
jgi:CxxC motif-containing protein (DUF1111 family)